MGTYGFAQFQIDVRQADEDLQRAVDEFKRMKTVNKHVDTTSTMPESTAESCEESEE